MSAAHIRTMRQKMEDYLEAQIALGELTKAEAQTKYQLAMDKLVKMKDFSSINLDEWVRNE